MKVIKHVPAPPPPSFTYDLVGLTADELTIVHHLLGRAGQEEDREAGVPKNTGYRIYDLIDDVLMDR